MIAAAVYTLTAHMSMGLGPAGDEGRWGLQLGRDLDEGAGVGLGLAAGLAVVGDEDRERSAGAFITSTVRPGFFFHKGGEVDVSLFIGVPMGPSLDVLGDGSGRLSIVAQPGYRMTIAWFAFGLSMNIEDCVFASGPRDEPGFGVGMLMQMGAAF